MNFGRDKCRIINIYRGKNETKGLELERVDQTDVVWTNLERSIQTDTESMSIKSFH